MEPERNSADTARIAQLEAHVGSVATSVDKLATHVSQLGEKVGTIGDKVASLDASQGRIPIGTIFGAAGFVGTIVMVVGALTVNPMRDQIADLKLARKSTVETFIPNLQSNIATILADNAESERERSLMWDLHHDQLYRNGRMDEAMGEVKSKLVERYSKHDDAQNARLEALERMVGEVESEQRRRTSQVYGALK